MAVMVENYDDHTAPVDDDDHMTLAVGRICSHKMVAIPFLHNNLVRKESIVCVDITQAADNKHEIWETDVFLDVESWFLLLLNLSLFQERVILPSRYSFAAFSMQENS